MAKRLAATSVAFFSDLSATNSLYSSPLSLILCHLLTQAAVDRLTKESSKASKEDPLGSPLVTTRPAFSIESDLPLVLK